MAYIIINLWHVLVTLVLLIPFLLYNMVLLAPSTWTIFCVWCVRELRTFPLFISGVNRSVDESGQMHFCLLLAKIRRRHSHFVVLQLWPSKNALLVESGHLQIQHKKKQLVESGHLYSCYVCIHTTQPQKCNEV